VWREVVASIHRQWNILRGGVLSTVTSVHCSRCAYMDGSTAHSINHPPDRPTWTKSWWMTWTIFSLHGLTFGTLASRMRCRGANHYYATSGKRVFSTKKNMKCSTQLIYLFWGGNPWTMNGLADIGYHHYHWLDSPAWALAFLRSFCQLVSGYCLFRFGDKSFTGWDCQPHAHPPAILEGRCFLSGLSPLAD
jgi:hypothetical protein